MWNRLVYIIIALLLLSAGFLLFKIQRNQTKPAIVDIVRVFEEFDMKKEYQKEYESKMRKVSVQIDSLTLGIESAMASGVESSSLKSEILRSSVERRSKLLDQKKNMENDELLAIDSQIQERLSVYLKLFGEENGYSYIVPKSSELSVITVDTTLDVTSKAIDFVNMKYSGEK